MQLNYMRKNIFYIAFLITLFNSASFTQIFLPPYQLEPVDTFANYYNTEGYFFSKDSLDYVFLQPSENFKYKKFITFVSSETKKLRKRIQVNNLQLEAEIYVENYDADSLSEMIFAATGKHKLRFFYYDNGNVSEFFSLDIPKKYFNGNFIIIPTQLDNDKAKEVIVIVNTIMPIEGSIRGMFAFDLETKKLLWKKLHADFISAALPFTKNDENFLALFTYARGGNLIYANGKFYSTLSLTASNIKIDSTAKDFSTDKYSYLKIIKASDGKEIYRKLLGGKGLWPSKFSDRTKNYDLILKFKNISLNTNQPNLIIGFQTSDYSLDTLFSYYRYIDHNNRIVSFTSKTIIQLNDTTLLLKRKNDIQTVSIHFPRNIRLYEFYQTKIGDIFTASNGSNGFLYNGKQELIANTGNIINVSLKENSDEIFIKRNSFNQNFHTTFFRLSKLPIYSRLSAQTYLTLFIFLLAIALFFVILWVATMFVSYKKIKRQNAELEATTSKLIHAEKLSALGTIAGSIAHQINSPLGAIINATGRLQRKGIEDPNLDLISEAGGRIKTIVNKFLISTRSAETEEKGISFNEAFNDWYSLFSHDFSNQKISIEYELKNGDIILPLTPSEANEIINNLIFNSRDAILKADKDSKRIINIETDYANGNFIITVKDNGTGFDPKMLKNGIKIFATTKERGKGSGLGLWIIKSILKNVHGTIEIANHQDGAIVTIKIPVKRK